MNRMMFFAVVLVLIATQHARGAKLVVIAVNSGRTPIAPSETPLTDQPPVDPPGAKGFLIGVDNSMGPSGHLLFALTFTSPNLVQRLAVNSLANETLNSADVQLRSDALVANLFDLVPDSHFASNDSWWWDAAQTVNGQTLTLSQINPGIQAACRAAP